MNVTKTSIPNVVLIKFPEQTPSCGSIIRTYCWDDFRKAGLYNAWIYEAEMNISNSNTLSGLRYNTKECDQHRFLIRCMHGSVNCAIVDLRKGHSNFGITGLVSLDAKKAEYLYIPAGFAHGFLSLSDDVVISYKSDKPIHNSTLETMNPCDPALAFDWPDMLCVSQFDKHADSFEEVKQKLYLADCELAVESKEIELVTL